MAVVWMVVDATVPGCRSLKEKRRVLVSLRDRLGAHSHLAFCELAHQDKWQRTRLGFVAISSDRTSCYQSLDHVLNMLDETGMLEIFAVNREELA